MRVHLITESASAFDNFGRDNDIVINLILKASIETSSKLYNDARAIRDIT